MSPLNETCVTATDLVLVTDYRTPEDDVKNWEDNNQDYHGSTMAPGPTAT